MLAAHNTGSPTAVVFEDNFVSETVQLISEPAGTICLAAKAVTVGDNKSVQRARCMLFIKGLLVRQALRGEPADRSVMEKDHRKIEQSCSALHREVVLHLA